MIPRATYRMQFHRGFTFAHAIPLVSYLKQLGISHLYSSPILTARAGSTHGYDVIDHTRINPELGGEEGFRALVAALRQNGLGLIVDIVPNHMAVGGSDNPWWLDVLERGPASRHAIMFDIDWEPPDPSMRGKVLVPLLGKALDEAIASGEINLIWDEVLHRLAFAYHDHRFPLQPEDYPQVSGGSDPRDADLSAWNNPEALTTLLARQHYRLAHWQSAPETINWRRFFDVNGLAALRMEDERVFAEVHAKLFDLYREGLIDGVRVDHIDGLADPRTYCRSLRARLDELDAERPAGALPGPAYLVVEKILAPHEQLARDWGVDGTTGYDFMNDVSAVEHDGGGEKPLTDLWVRLSRREAEFDVEECIARCELLHAAFASHLHAAAAAFHRLALFSAREIGEETLQRALTLILQQFRAYRTYAIGYAPDPPPGPFFEAAIQGAAERIEPDNMPALEFIAATMRGDLAEFGAVARRAARYFNQLAAPVAAKAVEDTAFYRYGRLLSRNDVGFSPAVFAYAKSDFDRIASLRQENFPHALLATATHDHKRGEDVRARLAVLSEWSERWEEEVQSWFALNSPLRGPEIDGGDEYQLYQTLVGTWPPDLPPNGGDLAGYAERILGWREKSLREAKLHTSWTEPNLAFEEANAIFVEAILDPERAPEFLGRLVVFIERVAVAGACNGLVQCILRCTAPGIPDLYQGTEFWDFSLVDPDNRRPVDYTARRNALACEGTPSTLLSQWKNGRVKQALLARLLSLRAQVPALFANGEYVPLAVEGPRAQNVVAYLRRHEGPPVLIAVPRLCASACVESGLPNPRREFWDCTKVIVPGRKTVWRSALDPEKTFPAETAFDCAALFEDFPGAVLMSQSR